MSCVLKLKSGSHTCTESFYYPFPQQYNAVFHVKFYKIKKGNGHSTHLGNGILRHGALDLRQSHKYGPEFCMLWLREKENGQDSVMRMKLIRAYAKMT